MKILFSAINTSYACASLAAALQANASVLNEEIVARYGNLDDQRTLAVLFTCPCCSGVDQAIASADLIVSAFKGVDPDDIQIDGEAKFHPPHRAPGQDSEARTNEEYRESVLDEIARVLG